MPSKIYRNYWAAVESPEYQKAKAKWAKAYENYCILLAERVIK